MDATFLLSELQGHTERFVRAQQELHNAGEQLVESLSRAKRAVRQGGVQGDVEALQAGIREIIKAMTHTPWAPEAGDDG